MTTIVLTGASGILGMELLPRLRQRYPGASIVSLVRSPEKVIVRAGETLLRADVTDPRLKETPAAAALADASYVIHMAADIRFNQERSTALEVNAEGTRRVLDILQSRARRLERFVHVSTAYVDVPNRCSNCAPFVIDGAREFNNAYEHSKWIGEQYVQASGLPWTIVRPSLVVSLRQSEIKSRYCGVNLLLEFMARGIMPIAIGEKGAIVDTVPDTHVADSIVACLDMALENQVAIVSAGSQSTPLRGFLDAAANALQRARTRAGLPRIHEPVLVECEKYHRLYYPFVAPILKGGKRRQLELLLVLHPYFVLKRSFASSGSAVLFDCPDISTALEEGFDEWCGQNTKLVNGRPYDWTESLKPEYRHIGSPLTA